MKILHLLSTGRTGGIEVLCQNIVQYSRYENDFCFLFAGGVVEDQMATHGDRVYSLYKYPRLRRYAELIRIVKRRKYSVIVEHHGGGGIFSFFLLLISVYKPCKYIKYFHGVYQETFFGKRNIKNIAEKCMLTAIDKRIDRAVAVSEFVKQWFCKLDMELLNKTRVIYNGVKIPDIEKVPDIIVQKIFPVLGKTVALEHFLHMGRVQRPVSFVFSGVVHIQSSCQREIRTALSRGPSVN